MRGEIQVIVRSRVLRENNPISCKPSCGSFFISAHDEAMHQMVYPLIGIFAVFLCYVENHLVEIFIPTTFEVPPYTDILQQVPARGEMFVPKGLKMYAFKARFRLRSRCQTYAFEVIELIQHRKRIEVTVGSVEQPHRQRHTYSSRIGPSANSL
ncbi:hypothetical protein WK73_15120 [Burkholderia ubonensis]|nr:hypothetical protein WK73_15120 [Burkholderia ubonensis]